MPRVMVIADQNQQDQAKVLLDERVESVHLSDEHSAMQLVERLGWAISDAEDAERVQVRRAAPRRARSSRPSARPRTRHEVHA
jgi:hypothetical protein